MDRTTAKILAAINTRFYALSAASFSQTRNAPWEGWSRCLKASGIELGARDAKKIGSDSDSGSDGLRKEEAVSSGTDRSREAKSLSLLDIACGNLRFERFLLDECPDIAWHFFALDNCEPLLASADEGLVSHVHFTCEDVVENLIEGLPAVEPANDGALAQAFPFDLVVSFGFMHHIPGVELRERFLKEALNMTKPGGFLIVSFWQFLNDPAKRERVEETHARALEFFFESVEGKASLANFLPKGESDGGLVVDRAELERALEQGDHFLGWKNQPGCYRYCHHFSDEEIERLITSLDSSARLVTSFSADGKTGDLNRYVVLQRRED